LFCSASWRAVHDLVDKRGEFNDLGVQLQLARLDLREVEHLIDEAEQVGPRSRRAISLIMLLIVILLATAASLSPVQKPSSRLTLVLRPATTADRLTICDLYCAGLDRGTFC
jgi:hypothetical protein